MLTANFPRNSGEGCSPSASCTFTDVPHGDTPYAPSLAAAAQLASLKFAACHPVAGLAFAFHAVSVVSALELPSEYKILIAASSPAGLAPPLLTSARFVASTANTTFAPAAVLALSGTVNCCAVIHTSVSSGAAPTCAPSTHSVKRSSAVITTAALTACFPAGGVNVRRNATVPAGALAAAVFQIQVAVVTEGVVGVGAATTTCVSQGSTPYVPSTTGADQEASEVEGSWKFAGMEVVAFHAVDEEDETTALEPSVKVIWAEKSSAAGPAPPVPTSGRFVALIAKRTEDDDVERSTLRKIWAVFHTSVVFGADPTRTPLAYSVKRSSAVATITALAGVLPAGGEYVRRSATSPAGAFGAVWPGEGAQIHDALVKAVSSAAGTTVVFFPIQTLGLQSVSPWRKPVLKVDEAEAPPALVVTLTLQK